MKSTLAEFKSGLFDLTEYIKALDIEAQLLSSASSCRKTSACKSSVTNYRKHLERSYTKKRRFNYNSIIVSLYGYLEQYIENLINKYVNAINDIVPHYGNLDDQFKAHHLRLSLDLIKKSDYSRYKNKISTSKVIENLSLCLNGATSYQLNNEAFAQHSANFKLEVINESFKFVGIDNICEKVLSTHIFEEYLRINYPERFTSSIKSEEVLFPLQDLAERRNQVAHGILPDELLSFDILQSYVVLFDAFGNGLLQVCETHLLPYIANHKALPLGHPTDVFRGGNVICLYISDIKIKVGDEIISRSGDGKNFRIGAIQEIQVDDNSLEEVIASSRVEVGLQLPFISKKSYEFFLPYVNSHATNHESQ